MLDILRERQGWRFDPALIGTSTSVAPGFDEKIIGFYVRGMSTCDIQVHIEEIYGIGTAGAQGACAGHEGFTAPSAEAELTAFEGLWGQKYPAIGASWRRRGVEVIPFFTFSSEVRKIIYTTNAVESLHSQVRKTIRTRATFRATMLIYLALRNISVKWKRAPKEWLLQGPVGHPVRGALHQRLA